MNIKISLILLSFLVISCTSNFTRANEHTSIIDANAELRKHVVSISRDGELLNINFGKSNVEKKGEISYQSSMGILSNDSKNDSQKDIPGNCESTSHHDNIRQYFCNITNNIKKFSEENNRKLTCGKANKLEIIIYIHGGLNTDESSINRAYYKHKKIMKNCIYPIFINWKSGPLATYSDHLFRIRQGEISKNAPFSSPIYFLTDIANSLINAPKAWTVVGSNSISSTIGANYKNYTEETIIPGDPKVLYKANDENFNSLGRSAQWILTSPAKVISTPFTYTLAKPAWDMMLRRTNTLFIKPSDFSSHKNDSSNFKLSSNIQENHQLEKNIESHINNGSGTLTKFITHLSNHLKNNSFYDKNNIEVTVIGHSMGAIVVNKLISIKHELPIKNIVHLASADSIENLFLSVIPYLRNNPITCFYSLSLHPENENREVSAWGLTPSGSLLVWVDEMYTTPESILNKRSGRWDKMEQAINLIPEDIADRMSFKVYGINNNKYDMLIKSPQKHGDFGDTAFWKEETWWK